MKNNDNIKIDFLNDNYSNDSNWSIRIRVESI